jgi:hypothetical protein
VKPNFLVIGAMKCATTSVCDILASHPQIFLTNPKEPDFFCDDKIFSRGWKWYESLFENATGKLAIGEGSTGYTKALLHPQTAKRIAQHLPNAKLIYIARHPLKRIESHWLHLIAAGLDVPPFRKALEQWPHMIDTSLYWKQISRYRHFYPDEKLLILFFEDYVKSPHAEIERAYHFLGVAPELATDNPGQPRHVSATLRVDTKLARFLCNFPGAKSVKKLTPAVAHGLVRMLQRPMPDRPTWPADLRERVIRQLSEDTKMFLTFYGKAADYWDLN